MKLTAWYDSSIKPVHIGVYSRTINHEKYFSYWGGAYWGVLAKTVKDAAKNHWTRSTYQSMPWRGLTTKDGS